MLGRPEATVIAPSPGVHCTHCPSLSCLSTVNREPSCLVAASPLSLSLVTAVLLACWPTCSSRSHGFFPFAKTRCKWLLLQEGSCASQHFPDLCVRGPHDRWPGRPQSACRQVWV